MTSDIPHDVWLDTDENEDFINSLERCAAFAQDIAHDVHAWKWLIISLHLALQGACVCALTGRHSSSLANPAYLTDKSAEKWKLWFGQRRRQATNEPAPERRLAELRTLFNRVREPAWL